MSEIPLWVNVTGWIASGLVVAAYALNILGRIKSTSGFYLWGNIFGSIGLIINTWYIGAYPSTFVNVVWVLIALWGVFRSRLLTGGSL